MLSNSHVQPNDRLDSIDMLRGIILFGVMLVNAATINGPYFFNAIDFAFKFNDLDYMASEIISILFLEKSYPIFVFLFGLSNQLLLAKLKKTHGQQAAFRVFIKRMLVLGIIGFIHLSLFYWGDVLLLYAMLGCLVGVMLNYFFLNDYKKLFKFNIGLIVLSIMINFFVLTAVSSDRHHTNFDAHFVDIATNHINDTHKPVYDHKEDIEDYLAANANDYSKVYQEGSLGHIVATNITSYSSAYFTNIFRGDLAVSLSDFNYFLEVLILIICGILASSLSVWQQDITKNKIFVAYLIFSGVIYAIYQIAHELDMFFWLNTMNILLLLNNIAFYILIFLFIFNLIKNHNYDNLIKNFSAVGKMTLTWYLLHSVIMAMILFNYGLGLYGKIGVFDCALISILYYYICYKISPIWLSYFKQGPVEKYWRYLTMPPKFHSI